MIQTNSDFKDLISCLNRFQVKYLLIGGYAVIYYSEPRYTKDMDIWIEPSKDNSAKIYQALLDFGAPLIQLNIKEEDFSKKGFFVQFGLEPSRIDILMSPGELDFEEAWKRKNIFKVDNIDINVASVQDLIELKNTAGRPQDLIDIQSLQKATAVKNGD